LGRLQRVGAGEVDQLVEAPVNVAFGARSVGADDGVDGRVVEDAEILERVDETPEVMVGVLEYARVALHLARQNRLQVVRNVVPGRDLLVPGGQLRLGRNHT